MSSDGGENKYDTQDTNKNEGIIIVTVLHPLTDEETNGEREREERDY